MRRHTQQLSMLVIAFFSFAIQIRAEPTKAPALPVVADPVRWIAPAEEPVLREVLTGVEYDKKFDAVLKSISADLNSNSPYAGIVVDEVAPDSQASQLGISVDDLIVSIDGRSILSGSDLSDRHQRADRNQLIKLWSFETKSYKLINVTPGPIGIKTRNLLRPDLAYLQSLPKGTKPSNELLVAAASLNVNNDLAESALFHAQQAKEKSPFFELLAADVALEQMRFEDALAFGDVAAKKLPADLRWTTAETMSAAAVASFHWQIAVDLDKKYQFLIPDKDSPQFNLVENNLASYRQMPVESMANPVEEFARLKSKDFSRKVQNVGLHEAGMDRYANDFRSKGSMAFNDPGTDKNRFENMMLGPKGANVDFSATVHFKPSNDKQTAREKMVYFSILNDEGQSNLVQLAIRDDGFSQITADPAIPSMSYNLKSQIQRDHKFKVRIAVVGNRLEVVINGIRLYYSPVLEPEASRQLSIFMMMTCVQGEVTELGWHTAEAR